MVEVNREEEIGQTLWVLLYNEKTQVRMGVVYGPQEHITPNSELKKLKISQTKLTLEKRTTSK